MYLVKFNLKTIIIMLAINSYAYNYSIRYQNDGVDKYHFDNLNDALGFAFSDCFDDLRSGSLIFMHESKYNFMINAEAHMLTFRGNKDSPEQSRKRADLLEIGFMYYLPFSIKTKTQYFGNINIGIGIKNLLYGNWGGALIQRAVHFTLRQMRPIPKNYENYNYRGFLSAAINYSYMRFFNLENYIDLSYFADYFFKTSISMDFKNESIGIETKFFYQAQNEINNMETYSQLQKAETGIGIQYRLHSKNFFTINNLNLNNFSNKEKFFSVGGFGIVFTEEYENNSEDNLYTLNQNFSFGYDIMIPFQTRNSIYYRIMPQLNYYFAIATNYDINLSVLNSRTNRFSSGLTYELFTKNQFTLYACSGIFLSYNQDTKDVKSIYRPLKIKDTLQAGFEIEPGMSINTFIYNKTTYNIKIFTKINYSPIVYNTNNHTLETHKFTFNYIGIGIKINI
ncbi:hypothetical protein [Borrelia hermsii]|uniref:Uncharacterized protein n=2 Tax=Borrelia hermsii TaxID=140 RepID=A0AAN0X5U4_BORHE|nr:hypothetical protein [Borrelia hermsii]AAX16631.1 hypothetical protein BH0110 [Borrelia hermsii DAH]AJW72938.1 hypothetical protein L283_00535 [Borrelia hermsii CC1]AMR75706.1 hypothetical protein A0V01_03785 [Borrelia hermsii]UCP01146.1 hypothetical protein K9R62_00545 [Borrelia hermsii]UEQ06772.1 hypothetical protein LEQ40_00540 [Borrelia hermsii]